MADAERMLYDARSAVDRSAARRRAGGGSEADLTAARLAAAGLGAAREQQAAVSQRAVAAARLAGINVRRHTVLIYALSGLCCGIAAIMVTSLSNAGSSTHGDLYELQAIAACIIGGTSLLGGRGTLVGSVLGVLVFTQISNLFVINNLQLEYQLIAQGVIIVGAVLVQQFRITGRRATATRT